VDLHPEGNWIASVALGTSGTNQVGYVGVLSQGPFGGLDATASLWSGTAASWVSLHPAVATTSEARGVFGTQQVGAASIGGVNHASLWNGTAESWVDLNPVGATLSEAFAVFDGWQVGYAEIEGIRHASLWNGSAGSWLDLGAFLPSGSSGSTATGVWSEGSTIFVSGYAGNAAVIWTIPTPGSTGLLVFGFLRVARRRSRA
jgi:hypothetical protein